MKLILVEFQYEAMKSNEPRSELIEKIISFVKNIHRNTPAQNLWLILLPFEHQQTSPQFPQTWTSPTSSSFF